MKYTFEYICDQASMLKRKYDETDPFRLCKDLKIKLLFISMGTGPECCKGFFLQQSRIKCITINSDLSHHLQRIICAHELGHAILHKDKTGISAFHDFALFDSVSSLEYEANIFAAELLLTDDDVLSNLNAEQSFFQAASALNVPAEILDFKFRTLKRKGYKVIDAPLMSSGDFLKNVTDVGKFINIY